MTHNTDDLRILEIKELSPPSHVLREFPISATVSDLVFETRGAIHRILHGEDDRLVVVVGPCSIHDTAAALEYAGAAGASCASGSPTSSRSSCGSTSRSRAPRWAGRG